MVRKRLYQLTATAELDFRAARYWSQQRWGRELTRQYFQDLHDAANTIAAYPERYAAQEDLTGDTGLSIHAVREHYLVYVPLEAERIAVVALIRQTRDVPGILRAQAAKIRHEITAIKAR